MAPMKLVLMCESNSAKSLLSVHTNHHRHENYQDIGTVHSINLVDDKSITIPEGKTISSEENEHESPESNSENNALLFANQVGLLKLILVTFQETLLKAECVNCSNTRNGLLDNST